MEKYLKITYLQVSYFFQITCVQWQKEIVSPPHPPSYINDAFFICHLWTMRHLDMMKQCNVRCYCVLGLNRPPECDLKKHSSLPEPYPTILYHISLYIMNFLNGQAIYLDNQPTHWCVHFCVGFLFFVRFPLSAALSLMIRSDAGALYSAASPKMSCFLRSISAKSNSEPVILR